MPKNKIILFWSTFDINTDQDYDDWINKKINITPLHHLSLHSHTKLKNDTTLYSYQKFNEGQVPEGIKIKDANEVLNSRQAFVSLKYGHSIAHISDAVRLKAASDTLGIVMDMDAVVIKDLPKYDCWFASMPAKLTGGFAPKWGASHPPLHINDKSWDGKSLAAFPLKVNEITRKKISSLSDKILDNLKKEAAKGSKAWNYILWDVKKMMSIDPNSKVYKPLYFCPLPAWLNDGKCYSLESPTRLDGKTELFGHTLPAISEIFKKSYVIQHFFESATKVFNNTTLEKVKNYNFWKIVPKDCLLAKEASLVFGKNWQNILIEKTNKIL